jgi:hypothetical protein
MTREIRNINEQLKHWQTVKADVRAAGKQMDDRVKAKAKAKHVQLRVRGQVQEQH